MVMPIPHMVSSIAAEWTAYGNWSFALAPYISQQLMEYLFTSPVGMQSIADIVDPAVFLSRLNIPVWNIMATADEFTLPDSPRFWFDQLPGEKYLRIIPNTDHTLADVVLDVVSDIAAFYHLLANNISRPVVTWNLTHATSGIASIVVKTSKVPVTANVWWADTVGSKPTRDFRLIICPEISCAQGVFWFPKKLAPQSDGSYVASFSRPAAGFTGFLIQLDYEYPNARNGDSVYFRVSTEVNIVPNIFPFPPCPQSQCNNPPKA
jgi:PhoPQ-activated pathogenicity-related protein